MEPRKIHKIEFVRDRDGATMDVMKGGAILQGDELLMRMLAPQMSEKRYIGIFRVVPLDDDQAFGEIRWSQEWDSDKEP